MAKILQCPSCHSTMDVTDVAPGSAVECPECAHNCRVPSGNTSMRTKTVSEPIPAGPTRPASNSQLRAGSSPRLSRAPSRSRSGTMPAAQPQPKSHGGLFIGLGIGVLGIMIVAILFTMKDQHQQDDFSKKIPVPQKGPAMVTFNPTLPPSSDKPIVLGEGNKGEPRTTALSRPPETAENVNWPLLMQQLRPGGGFDHLDRPEGVAFQKVKSLGPAAYPKLIAFIDDEDTAIGTAAVAVLNALTGREEPLPKGVNKGKIKIEWQDWLKNAPTAKPTEPAETKK